MTKLLKKECKTHLRSDYFYKTLVFKFLDIGLFEAPEMKKNAYKDFLSNLSLEREDILNIIKLLKNDPTLLDMIRLWASKETLFNLKFLEKSYYTILPREIFSLKYLQYMVEKDY